MPATRPLPVEPFRSKTTLAALAALLLLFCAETALAAMPALEEARINAMLNALSRQTDTVFIRNGSEHSADEAVSHLRLKLARTRGRLSTAEQFIDRAASSSSISGKPYYIRRPGEQAQPAGPYLRELLQKVAP